MTCDSPLVLVDEAHHSPAATWRAVLDAFPTARRVLFTATPFRRDGREIKGSFIYTYPLLQAYEDDVFGEIAYHPVGEVSGVDNDLLIAQEAARVFQADQAAGFDHILMVRANTKKKASELADLYAKNTALRLEIVDSDRDYRDARETIARLDRRELDGVVCVNMMSEGFDFPRLKIAALHAPHKSLAVTLQFVGRFARKNGPRLGAARFLAIPSEIEIEREELFSKEKVWSKIVPDLLDKRVSQEQRSKVLLETFESREISDDELNSVSLWALRPSHHVRVYEIAGEVDLDAAVRLPRPFDVRLRSVSDELSAAIFIAAEYDRPRWTSDDRFTGRAFHLFIVHYHESTGYLFVNASEKSDRLYEDIVRQFAPGGARRLMQSVVTKAMAGLKDLRIFNLGMRRRALGSGDESYRIYTGTKAHRVVTRTDGLSFHPGHLFGQGAANGRDINIGVSLASKVWSLNSSQIPGLIEWFDILAKRLVSDETVITNSEWDNLSMGEPVTEIPEGVIAAKWHEYDYERPCEATYVDATGQVQNPCLLDFGLAVDQRQSDSEKIRLNIIGPDFLWAADFCLNANPQFRLASPDQQAVVVDCDGQTLPLIDHLNHRSPVFFFADRSMLVERELFRTPIEGTWEPFECDQIKVIDWSAATVDIEVEEATSKKSPRKGCRSIHDYVAEELCASDYDVIFFDHTKGEVADFLAIRREVDHIRIEAYHCKGSGGATPGKRLKDLQEVSCQVVQNLWLLQRPERLRQHVKRRSRLAKPRFIKGDHDDFRELMSLARSQHVVYQLIIVQPGVTQSAINEELGSLLASAHDYVRGASCEPLAVWGSA